MKIQLLKRKRRKKKVQKMEKRRLKKSGRSVKRPKKLRKKLQRLQKVVTRMRTGNAARPVLSESIFLWCEDAWTLASLVIAKMAPARSASGR